MYRINSKVSQEKRGITLYHVRSCVSVFFITFCVRNRSIYNIVNCIDLFCKVLNTAEGTASKVNTFFNIDNTQINQSGVLNALFNIKQTIITKLC